MADVLESAVDEEILSELRSWLRVHWDPDLTVGGWWELLGTSGWAAPTLPDVGIRTRRGPQPSGCRSPGRSPPSGRSVPRTVSVVLLAAPTIADHGTPEQIDTLVRDIVTGRRAWCQLFSEPGAGSDLAGLTTRAERDGDEWVVNGQKVWTSLATTPTSACCWPGPSPDLPKHQGITYFALDMHQPGVEVRPLREMTGHAMFNETFLTDARVPDASIVGGRNNGWAVANTTLGYERTGLGSGGGGRAAGCPAHAGHGGREPGPPGRGHGARPSGRIARGTRRRTTGGPVDPACTTWSSSRPVDAVRSPTRSIRQDLVRLYVLDELGRMNA